MKDDDAFLCVTVVLMGWSWAPWLAQNVLEDMLSSSPAGLEVACRVCDRGVVPSFRAFQRLHWAYLDDFMILFLQRLLEGAMSEEGQKL